LDVQRSGPNRTIEECGIFPFDSPAQCEIFTVGGAATLPMIARKPPSNRIRQARRSAKLSQGELAARLGVYRSVVTQWESTEGTHPTMEHLAQIAIATGASFEWLGTGRGRMKFTSDLVDEESLVDVHFAAQDESEVCVLVGLRKLEFGHVQAVIDLIELLGQHKALKLKRKVAYSR